ESHGRQCGPRLRNPLIVFVGKAALEIGLETEGPRHNMPATILLLGAKQVIHAAAVNRVGRRCARFVERPQGFGSSVGVTAQVVGLAPSSVGALFRDQLLNAMRRRLAACPDYSQDLHGAVLDGAWLGGSQPRGGAGDSLIEFGLAALNGEEAKRAN